jgi:hypothetical protein
LSVYFFRIGQNKMQTLCHERRRQRDIKIINYFMALEEKAQLRKGQAAGLYAWYCPIKGDCLIVVDCRGGKKEGLVCAGLMLG